jgi:hypothetical protein
LQFAPNSTVCALSSDVLCSDALAAAIAEDGKSVWELVREFEQYFAPDQSYEAPKKAPERLLDGRYIAMATAPARRRQVYAGRRRGGE